eukprot:CAMPEP_0113565764 /NCGR_PEP_ID=MMETSP0015_2-20120614/22359_1 /TAXON_ID=2838 /ORGANISM="Odontella" /LENGTH=85 /DNA_ID=CAMNT_0000467999 /DNA_START=232 /DNA_END=486 /DNA_ORIENTATION=- /assembly_acc=CAM_ASM_000160
MGGVELGVRYDRRRDHIAEVPPRCKSGMERVLQAVRDRPGDPFLLLVAREDRGRVLRPRVVPLPVHRRRVVERVEELEERLEVFG